MITFIAVDRATGRTVVIRSSRESFFSLLRSLGKTRLYDALFTTKNVHNNLGGKTWERAV